MLDNDNGDDDDDDDDRRKLRLIAECRERQSIPAEPLPNPLYGAQSIEFANSFASPACVTDVCVCAMRACVRRMGCRPASLEDDEMRRFQLKGRFVPGLRPLYVVFPIDRVLSPLLETEGKGTEQWSGSTSGSQTGGTSSRWRRPERVA